MIINSYLWAALTLREKLSRSSFCARNVLALCKRMVAFLCIFNDVFCFFNFPQRMLGKKGRRNVEFLSRIICIMAGVKPQKRWFIDLKFTRVAAAPQTLTFLDFPSLRPFRISVCEVHRVHPCPTVVCSGGPRKGSPNPWSSTCWRLSRPLFRNEFLRRVLHFNRKQNVSLFYLSFLQQLDKSTRILIFNCVHKNIITQNRTRIPAVLKNRTLVKDRRRFWDFNFFIFFFCFFSCWCFLLWWKPSLNNFH